MKKLIILLLLFITFSNCNKKEYYCADESNETLVKIYSNNDKEIYLFDNLTLSISNTIGDDTRCREWLLNETMNCSNNFGNVLIESSYSLFNATDFSYDNKQYFTELEGCVNQYKEHLFTVEDKKIEVYLESVEAYPTPNDTVPDENYFAIYRIKQTSNICKEKL